MKITTTVTAERAKSLKKKPAYVLGVGECLSHNSISNMPELTVTGAARSGTLAFGMAGLKPADVKAIELSGGNQQKVVIAKALVQDPDLIIFDEPTRGVDVGAISEIHAIINRLADEGKAVVVISSYLPEVMAISDRILVQRMGKVVEEYSATEATEEKIMYAAIH